MAVTPVTIATPRLIGSTEPAGASKYISLTQRR